jgi:hypothetical protein
MIIIGSALLLAIGLLILLVQAIQIAFSLIKIIYYLLKAIVCLVIITVCTVALAIQYVLKYVDWWERRAQQTVGTEILPPARLTRQV